MALSVDRLNEQLRDNMDYLKAQLDGLRCVRQAVWYVSGTLSTGTNKSAEIVYRGPAATILRADARVKTAPSGAAIIFDINVGGTSIWATNQSNRLQIAAGNTSGTQTNFDTTTITDGSVITIDIDQVGSSTPGESATVLLQLRYTPEVV
jgi:hypothetical protein